MIFPFLKKKKNTPITESAQESHKAILFVDFEYFACSLEAQYKVTADITAITDSIAKDYTIQDIYVFGNFTNGLEKYLSALNRVTENLYDFPNNYKNEKAFYMLDYLYQKGMEYKDSGATFILITGSSHFVPVTEFLTKKCNLNVGFYAVTDTLSLKLKNRATWVVDVPGKDTIQLLFPAIIDNFNFIAKSTKAIIPTYKTTVEKVSFHRNIDYDLVDMALQKMIDVGYVVSKYTVVNFTDRIKSLVVDWEKAIKDGLHDPNKS